MKRFTAVILAVGLIFSLAACQNQDDEPPSVSTPSAENQEPAASAEPAEQDLTQSEIPETKSILIAYFSLGRNADSPKDIDASTSASLVMDGEEQMGTTEYVAHLIQDNVGGDLHSIQTLDPYSSDFDTVVDQNHEEQDAGTLPVLMTSDLDVSQYDIVFIGYPIWATSAPQAVFSFLSQYDLSGKTLIPFCTHDGYGAGSSYKDIADAVSGAREVLDGLAVEASDVPDSEETVAEWLRSIDIEQQSETANPSGETAITISIGDTVLDGVLYNTALANEIQQYFPLTISMTGFGGREYYGGVDFYPENAEGGQKNFENGDITYCQAHHNMAIFYAQTDDPDLSVEVIPIGKVTSDLGIFHELPGSVEITFALADSLI